MKGNLSIPAEILQSDALRSNNAKLIYFHLLQSIRDSTTIFFSASAIANEIGISEKTVRNMLQVFLKSELISESESERPANRGKSITLCGIGINGRLNQRITKIKSERKSEPKSERLTTESSSDALNFKEHRYPFVDPMYEDAFSTWVEYKEKEFKDKYKTERTLQAAYKKLVELSGYNPCTAMQIVEQSMANRWKGLFELKTNGTNQRTTMANTAKESRDRMRTLASTIVSRSENLLSLYNGQGSDPDNCQN